MLLKNIALLSALTLSGFQSVRAAVIFESALLGPTGQTGGSYISRATETFPGQFLGARFHLKSPVLVDHIGGHLLGNGDGSLFGAIVSLDGPSALPSGTPSTFAPLAEVSLTPASPSSDVLVRLSLTLGPGDYALVFGSGRFGAAGTGHMPHDNIETGQATYFTSSGDAWWDAVPEGLRFVITATAVPEPCSVSLLPLGLVILRVCAWGRRSSRRPHGGASWLSG